jgi:hypothetical protein
MQGHTWREYGATPISATVDHGVYTFHYDPYTRELCCICYQPVTILKLYTSHAPGTPPPLVISGRDRDSAVFVVHDVQAAQFQPCGHEINPVYEGWHSDYMWPLPNTVDLTWPPPPECWGRRIRDNPTHPPYDTAAADTRMRRSS